MGKYNVGENNPLYKGKNCSNYLGVKMNCNYCGAEFVPKEIRGNRPRKYCSIKCSKMRVNNPNWLDGGSSMRGLHKWGWRNIPKPDICQCCGKEPPRDLANISQKYKKEVSDWEWLCRRCHMTKDGRMNNLNRTEKVLTPAKCRGCGIDFLQDKNKNKHCSRQCYLNSRIRKIQ